MRLHVISDIHGRTEALASASDGCDALVVLGDLLLFIDYEDHSAGIMADLFGAEAVTEFVRLRTANRHDEVRALTHRLWTELADNSGSDPRTLIGTKVKEQYARLFAAIRPPAYLTYGNVDVPGLWPEYLTDGMQMLDGETVELGGRTFGFVGGGLPSPMRTPMEIPVEEYAAKVAAVGAVDVLCCHIPPAIAELRYDVVARRFETGSEAVVEAIHQTQPALVLFGHVHQPLISRTRIGRTECVNVGHFRRTGKPYVLSW